MTSPTPQEKIIADAERLAKDVADLAKTGTEALGEQARQAGEVAKKSLTDAWEKTEPQIKKAQALAHEKPWILAAAAATLGAIIGLFASRRRQ